MSDEHDRMNKKAITKMVEQTMKIETPYKSNSYTEWNRENRDTINADKHMHARARSLVRSSNLRANQIR